MHHPFHACTPVRGFTLIEQLMVLAIIGVLLGIAVPPLHALMARNALQTAQSDFIAAAQNARATAVNRGLRTLLCPSTDARQCAAGTAWAKGWVLGVDADHDNQLDGAPLRVGGAYSSRLSIHSSSGRQLLRFLPDGSARGSNLTVLFCQPDKPSPALSVIVSNSGRIRGARASAQQSATCR